MGAARDHLAVDQNAVAIENDEIEVSVQNPRFQDLSSSGTQYNSSRWSTSL
jgi:hypothetical protein